MENPAFIVACRSSDNALGGTARSPGRINRCTARPRLWTGRDRGFIPRPRRWPDGRVAMQRTANPRTAVRFRLRPPLPKSATDIVDLSTENTPTGTLGRTGCIFRNPVHVALPAWSRRQPALCLVRARLAISFGYALQSSQQQALERLQRRDWVRLIDVSPTRESGPHMVMRAFHVMEPALRWFEKKRRSAVLLRDRRLRLKRGPTRKKRRTAKR
jgi:hypothetical protein